MERLDIHDVAGLVRFAIRSGHRLTRPVSAPPDRSLLAPRRPSPWTAGLHAASRERFHIRGRGYLPRLCQGLPDGPGPPDTANTRRDLGAGPPAAGSQVAEAEARR